MKTKADRLRKKRKDRATDNMIREAFHDACNRYSFTITRHCACFIRDAAGYTACCRAVFDAYLMALKKGQTIEYVEAWLHKEAHKTIKRMLDSGEWE